MSADFNEHSPQILNHRLLFELQTSNAVIRSLFYLLLLFDLSMKFSAYNGLLPVVLAGPTLAAAASGDHGLPTYSLSDDPAFSSKLLVDLQNALSGGADIGLILGAAKDIQPGIMDSYYA